MWGNVTSSTERADADSVKDKRCREIRALRKYLESSVGGRVDGLRVVVRLMTVVVMVG
jgi:hypothetical protein